MNMYFEDLTKEEFEVVQDTLKKMRAEKARQQAIQGHDQCIREVIAETIDAIGLEETKRIIRAINSDLRHSGAVDN